MTTAQFLSRWPLLVLHALGVCLGWIVFLLSGRYRATLLEMTRHYADDRQLSAKALFILRCKSIGHAGKGLLELPYVWFASGARNPVLRTQKHHWEVIDQAQQAGRGVLFLTPHLGCFEVAAQKYASHAPITVLYRPHRKAAMQAIIEATRARDNLYLAPTDMSGVRRLLRALKKGEAVGLLPDQVPSNGEGIWAPFFNRPAYTMTLPVKLFAATQATIVLVALERLSWGRGYVMHCFPGPQTLSEDVALATAQLNAAICDVIARYPEQYLWGYNRYKQPKGGAPLIDAGSARATSSPTTSSELPT